MKEQPEERFPRLAKLLFVSHIQFRLQAIRFAHGDEVKIITDNGTYTAQTLSEALEKAERGCGEKPA